VTTLARWCYDRRWIVVGLWLAALAVSMVLSGAIGQHYRNNVTLPGTDTERAYDLLKANFPAQNGDVDTIVLHARTGTLRDGGVRAAESAMLGRVADLAHVSSVVSPYAPGGSAQINHEGTIGYATVLFDRGANDLPLSAIRAVVDTAETGASRQVQVALEGQAIGYLNPPSTVASEIAGGIAAAVVLFLAFGSWRGMVLPLLAAFLALGIGVGIITMLSQVMPVAQFTEQLAALIGLGVGVDYALFIVSRHRNNLLHGMEVRESVIAAVNTSGRAVVFAGSAVSVALLGLMLLGVSFLVGVSLGAVITVVLTMLAALTLLPAMLGFMGPRILGRKRLAQLREHGPDDSHVTGRWLAWARRIERRPAPLALVAFVLILFVSLPAFAMRLGSSDQGNDPTSWTTREAYDLLSEGFGPGFNGPLQIIATVPATEAGRLGVESLQSAIRATPGVAAVTPATYSANQATAVFTAIPFSAPQDRETYQLVHHLRETVVPSVLARTPVTVAYVGGTTAAYIDFAHVLSEKLPLFIGVVVLAAFLLLMVAFRSVLVPATASVMNILAALASFGLLVFVFQQGHLGSVFSIGRPGPIDAFLPVMLFAVLFGLSMDYQVFLVSRMHEEWIHTHDNARAVTVGQAETGRVITAAASIMMVVFLAFVLAGQRQVAEFGLGLFGAVLLDAFVLRTVLVPAVMHTLGPANWYLPAWLEPMLPHVSIDPPDSADFVEVILDDDADPVSA